MSEYKFILNSKRKGTCPKCGKKKCFVYWYWRDTLEIVHKDCGVCDHMNGCGYKLSPMELEKDEWEKIKENPNYHLERVPQHEEVKKEIIPIEKKYLLDSLSIQHDDVLMTNLIRWFISLDIPNDKIAEALIKYHVGTTKNGSNIFWQVDEFGRIRSGKVMAYREDGHRAKDKEGNGTIGWIHTMLKQWGVLPADWELTQTLFGMHLLKREEYAKMPVAIVESEKTALILSTIKQDRLWMATGGLCNLKREKLESIIHQRREIILYPDKDGFEKWKAKADEIGYSKMKVSDYCMTHSIPEDGDTADIADIVIRKMSERQKPTYTLNDAEIMLGLTLPHAPLRHLIEKFNLTLTN